MKAKRLLIAILAIALVATLVTAVACNNHTHEYTKYEKNATQHWKVCPEDGEEEAGSRVNHSYTLENNTKCVCGAVKPADPDPDPDPDPDCEHTYGYVHVADTWTHNYQCTKCGKLAEEGVEGGDVEGLACTPELNVCADCGYTYTDTEIVTALYAIAKSNDELPGTYKLTGLVVKIVNQYNTENKNMTVDMLVAGKIVQCYGMSCDEGAVKLGATITATGTLMRYSNTYEFKNKTCEMVGEATYETGKTVSVSIEHGKVVGLPEGTQTNGTELTFTVEVDEGYELVSVSTQYQALTANEQNEYTATVIGDTTITVVIAKEVVKLTASVNVGEYAEQHNWTASASGTTDKYDTILLNDVVTAKTAVGEGKTPNNNGKYYSGNPGTWRLYKSEGATLTISVSGNYKLYSIMITFGSGSFVEADGISSGVAKLIEGDLKEITLTVNANIQISAIEVKYVETEGGEIDPPAPKCECDKCDDNCQCECDGESCNCHETEPAVPTITLVVGTHGALADGASDTMTTVDGKLASLPNVTVNADHLHCTFLGWFTAATGGEQVTVDTVFEGDATIYAQYQHEYVITLVVGDGTIDTEDVTYVTVNGKLPEGTTLPTAASTKAHFTFDAWYTLATGGVKVVVNSTVFSSDCNIYAQYTRDNGVWKGEEFVVTLVRNTGNTSEVEYWLGSEDTTVELQANDKVSFYINGKLCTGLWITGLGVKTEVNPKPSEVEVTESKAFKIFLKDYSKGAGTDYVVEFRADTEAGQGGLSDIPEGTGKITIKIGSLDDIVIYLVKADGTGVTVSEFNSYCIYTFNGEIFGGWDASATQGRVKETITVSGSSVPNGWIIRWGSNYGTQTANIEGVIKAGGTYMIKLPAASKGAAEVTEIAA